MSDLTGRAHTSSLLRASGLLDRLGEAQTRTTDLAKQLKDAEAALASAWGKATSAGWTPAELRELGMAQPASRRGGRPARTARRSSTT